MIAFLLLMAGCEPGDNEGLEPTSSFDALHEARSPVRAVERAPSVTIEAEPSARPAELAPIEELKPAPDAAVELPAMEPVAASVVDVPPELEDTQAPNRVAIERPVVSTLGGDLERSADNIGRYDSSMAEGAGLSARSGALAGGGAAELIEIRFPELATTDPATLGQGGVRVPNMTMPAAKTCLEGLASVMGENGEVAHGGPSAAAVKRGINRVAGKARGCFPAGAAGTHTMTAWVLAGCDGRVRELQIDAANDLLSTIVDCIEHTLRHAPLPAHALPDGQEMLIPLRFVL